jgi:hypothetical protein
MICRQAGVRGVEGERRGQRTPASGVDLEA